MIGVTRRIRTLLLLVIVGAAVNLCVSLASALFAGSGLTWSLGARHVTVDDRDVWSRDYPFDDQSLETLPDHLMIDMFSALGLRYERMSLWHSMVLGVPHLDVDAAAERLTVAAGWPMTSFAGSCWTYRAGTPSGPAPDRRVYRAAILATWPWGAGAAPPDPPMSGRLIPLRPLASGFAVNTLLYAVVCAAIFLGPGAARRRYRRKHRRCVSCGYPLAGTDHRACPECGATFEPRQNRLSVHMDNRSRPKLRPAA